MHRPAGRHYQAEKVARPVLGIAGARSQRQGWKIFIDVADQEMTTERSTNVVYWEGSVAVSGTRQGKTIASQGYLEMTGYAKLFDAPMQPNYEFVQCFFLKADIYTEQSVTVV